MHCLRDIAHQKALKSGSAFNWSSYRDLYNKATSMLRLAKAAYFNGLISSFGTKSGKFWRHIRYLCKCSRSVDNSFQPLVTANDQFPTRLLLMLILLYQLAN